MLFLLMTDVLVPLLICTRAGCLTCLTLVPARFQVTPRSPCVLACHLDGPPLSSHPPEPQCRLQSESRGSFQQPVFQVVLRDKRKKNGAEFENGKSCKLESAGPSCVLDAPQLPRACTRSSPRPLQASLASQTPPFPCPQGARERDHVRSFVYSFILSLCNKCLLRTRYMPGTVLDVGT